LVSRALGADDRAKARRLAASGLLQAAAIAPALVLPAYPFRADLLHLLGARDKMLEVASGFLAITLPSNVLMALGMALSGVLRAAGDARRAMYVTPLGRHRHRIYRSAVHLRPWLWR
jgi:Na+-driven multidrug efflux pump